MDLKSFSQAIDQIADEKGIERDKILETIEMAIAAAYKRDYGRRGQIIRAKLDPKTGKVTVKQVKIALDENMIKTDEEIAKEDTKKKEKRSAGEIWDEDKTEDGEIRKVRFNPDRHLKLEEAKKIKPDVKPGEELEFPLESKEEFGHIAAQTAKQVIIQRLREAEREAIFNEYKSKEGEVVSGIIQRVEGRNAFVDIGRTTAILPYEEQIPGERYRVGTRLKALVILVEKNPKGPGVFLSRSHPRFLKKLFEIEVPEIPAGIVEIKAIAREPGSRSKIAVTSHEPNVDPVGSLVGQRGVRVSTVISELGGEKIDVIEWSDDPVKFVANSLSPAKVLDVEVDKRKKEAYVVVPENEFSLAIGRSGQNVRLAAKLTGWKIDVRPPSEEIAQDGTAEPQFEDSESQQPASEA